MAHFTAATVRFPGDGLFHAIVSDLAIQDVAGHDILYAATLSGGGLSAFTLESGKLQLLGQVPWSGQAGTLATVDLAFLDAGSGPVLMPAGLANGASSALRLTPGGAPGQGYAFAPQGLPAADLVAAHQVRSGGQDYLVGARDGTGGLTIYRLGSDAATGSMVASPDGPRLTSLGTASVADLQFVLGVSAHDNALVCYRIDPDGTAYQTERIDAMAGMGFDTPGAVAVVEISGASYVILAGTQSSSLSVWRLTLDGRLVATDHVVDDLGSRFQGATALEVFTTDDGRAYVLAGGHDDGLSLFTLLPDGRLVLLTSAVDTAGVTLANVGAIAASPAGTHAQVFVSSTVEPGLTQLDLTLGPAGVALTGGAGTMTGTAGNDLLFAGSTTTALAGGEGDDILVATEPIADLRGGAGNDLFVLSPTAGTYVITDFELRHDRLDLSSLRMLRNADQIEWQPMASGVRLGYGATVIELRTANGTSLSRADFTETDLLSLTRFAPDSMPAVPVTRYGTPRADLLVGDRGDDLIVGGNQNDTLDGLAGDDLLKGESGNDKLFGSEGRDRLLGGNGKDYLSGGDDNDTLLGEAAHDNIHGDGGDDTLTGAAGNDRLFGGAGNDTLDGGAHRDILDGGDSNDTLWGGADIDQLYGGTGDDELRGGDGNDKLVGGDGDDGLSGDAGNDPLDGGSGQDLLSGGDCKDRLWGGDGNDSLQGDSGNDTLDGGSGDDILTGGTGTDILTGGSGADTFLFLSSTESPPGLRRDRIMDFEPGIDHLDLSSLQIDQAIGSSAFSGTATEIRWVVATGGVMLSADLDLDRKPDFEIFLKALTDIPPGDLIL